MNSEKKVSELKKKTNNEEIIYTIAKLSAQAAKIYPSTEYNLQFACEIKRTNPMGQNIRPIPSHGIKASSNPIPWDTQQKKSVPWDGMGLSHPIRSPALNSTMDQ